MSAVEASCTSGDRTGTRSQSQQALAGECHADCVQWKEAALLLLVFHCLSRYHPPRLLYTVQLKAISLLPLGSFGPLFLIAPKYRIVVVEGSILDCVLHRAGGVGRRQSKIALSKSRANAKEILFAVPMAKRASRYIN